MCSPDHKNFVKRILANFDKTHLWLIRDKIKFLIACKQSYHRVYFFYRNKLENCRSFCCASLAKHNYRSSNVHSAISHGIVRYDGRICKAFLSRNCELRFEDCFVNALCGKGLIHVCNVILRNDIRNNL